MVPLVVAQAWYAPQHTERFDGPGGLGSVRHNAVLVLKKNSPG